MKFIKALLLHKFLDLCVQFYHLLYIVAKVHILHLELDIFEPSLNLLNKVLFVCCERDVSHEEGVVRGRDLLPINLQMQTHQLPSQYDGVDEEVNDAKHVKVDNHIDHDLSVFQNEVINRIVTLREVD